MACGGHNANAIHTFLFQPHGHFNERRLTPQSSSYLSLHRFGCFGYIFKSRVHAFSAGGGSCCKYTTEKELLVSKCRMRQRLAPWSALRGHRVTALHPQVLPPGSHIPHFSASRTWLCIASACFGPATEGEAFRLA